MIVATSRASATSAGKVHRPRLANENDLDLARILELGFDTAGDLLRHRRHAHVVHNIRNDDHAHFATGLDREHLLHTLVARRDLLETFEPLDVRLERLATGARA